MSRCRTMQRRSERRSCLLHNFADRLALALTSQITDSTRLERRGYQGFLPVSHVIRNAGEYLVPTVVNKPYTIPSSPPSAISTMTKVETIKRTAVGISARTWRQFQCGAKEGSRSLSPLKRSTATERRRTPSKERRASAQRLCIINATPTHVEDVKENGSDQNDGAPGVI